MQIPKINLKRDPMNALKGATIFSFSSLFIITVCVHNLFFVYSSTNAKKCNEESTKVHKKMLFTNLKTCVYHSWSLNVIFWCQFWKQVYMNIYMSYAVITNIFSFQFPPTHKSKFLSLCTQPCYFLVLQVVHVIPKRETQEWCTHHNIYTTFLTQLSMEKTLHLNFRTKSPPWILIGKLQADAPMKCSYWLPCRDNRLETWLFHSSSDRFWAQGGMADSGRVKEAMADFICSTLPQSSCRRSDAGGSEFHTTAVSFATSASHIRAD